MFTFMCLLTTLMCAKSVILVILRGVEKEAVFGDSRASEKWVIKMIEWCKGSRACDKWWRCWALGRVGDIKRSLGELRGRGKKGRRQTKGETRAKRESWGVCNNFVCYSRDNNDEKKHEVDVEAGFWGAGVQTGSISLMRLWFLWPQSSASQGVLRVS